MAEPHEFPSPAAYRYALILAGESGSEADRHTAEAWARFQAQVEASDPSEYSSEEGYLLALITAGLELPEIDAKMEAVKRRIERQHADDELARRARDVYERSLEREEIRTDVLFERLRSRYMLDIEERELLQAQRPPVRHELAGDGTPYAQGESERERLLRGWVPCP